MTTRTRGLVVAAAAFWVMVDAAGAGEGEALALRVHVLDCGFMRAIPTDELFASVPGPQLWIQHDPESGPLAPALIE